MARDVVFTFWGETYADALRRQFMPPDRLAQTLQTSDRVGKLLLANPSRSAPIQIPKRLFGPEGRAPLAANTALIQPMRLRRKDSRTREEVINAYARYDRTVASAARRRGLEKPAVITTNPYYAAYGSFDWAGPVTYYAWDDWAALSALAPWWPVLNDAYGVISERGHRVCAVSQPLLDRLAPTGAGAVVSNGILPEEWQPPWQAPAWVEDLARPRILYAGAIHNRLNVDIFRQVAARFAQGSVIVIGPVADPAVFAELSAIPNIVLKGPVSRSVVAGLIHAVEVCIMPHHRNALTESMSPLKIYEYCAAGRPSVVTDLPPVHGIHKAVHIVKDGESFADAVGVAVAQGPIDERDRRAFLDANSWAERHDRIMDLALA